MRFVQHFCQNALVSSILSEFKVSQGALFHYTNRDAAKGIMAGELRLTRANCFEDPAEIKHGVGIFREAARTSLRDSEITSFVAVLRASRERLQSCFVMSMSQDPNNDFLQRKYARSPGAVLEFVEDLPNILRGGWHATPTGDGSFSLDFVDDAYYSFEGFVVYEDSQKQRLATRVCEAYRDLLSTDAHFVDVYHFTGILLKCLILCKQRRFQDEKEYRVALVRKPETTEAFVQTSTHDEGSRPHIRIRIPPSRAGAIRPRYV